jgi:hypothetical protein
VPDERGESVAFVPDERGESVAFPDELDEGGESIARLVPGPVPLPPPRSEDTKDASQWRLGWWSR